MPTAVVFGLFAFGRILYIVCQEGISVFHDTDHCFACVQQNFISVIIIISCRAVIGGLFTGNMDSPAVCEIPAVPRRIVALECKIALLIAHLKISILNEHIFKG